MQPLELPDPEHLPEVAALSHYEAIALFVERARAARADFGLTNQNAPPSRKYACASMACPSRSSSPRRASGR